MRSVLLIRQNNAAAHCAATPINNGTVFVQARQVKSFRERRAIVYDASCPIIIMVGFVPGIINILRDCRINSTRLLDFNHDRNGRLGRNDDLFVYDSFIFTYGYDF